MSLYLAGLVTLPALACVVYWSLVVYYRAVHCWRNASPAEALASLQEDGWCPAWNKHARYAGFWLSRWDKAPSGWLLPGQEYVRNHEAAQAWLRWGAWPFCITGRNLAYAFRVAIGWRNFE